MINTKLRTFVFSVAACSLCLVVSCSSDNNASNVLSGVAATGAPLSGATIEVYDSTGAKVATTISDSSGNYRTDTFAAVGPYVLKAISGNTVLQSVQIAADNSPVNITPLSNLVSTLLSPTGNAENLVNELSKNKAIIQASALVEKKVFVKSLIEPVAKAISLPSGFDVINTSMVANGTGIDQVLDNVSIAISPDTDSSTIQVVFKKAGPGEYEPQIITFSSKDSSSNVIASVNGVQYTSNDAYDPKMTRKILDWVKKNNDCHKIPAKNRWIGEAGSKVFTKDAEVCNRIFYNNNPALFKDFGVTAEEVFTGNYSTKTWTQDVVTEPQYVYTTATGEVMVRAKAVIIRDDDSTYERYFFFNLTPDPNNDNELRSLGNGYEYVISAFPRNAVHYFPFSPDFKFTYSGFQFDIPASGTRGSDTIPSRRYSQRVKRAEVVFPNNDTLHMYDIGREQLTACTSRPTDDNDARQKCSLSGFKVVRSDFYSVPTDPLGLGRTRPAEYDGPGFIDFGQLENESVKRLPIFGTFRVTLTLSNGSVLPVQRIPFFGRPKTQSEIETARSNRLIPAFTDTFISSLYQSTDNCRVDSNKFVFPVKKNSTDNCPASDSAFEASWTGMAQWIYMNGLVFNLDDLSSSAPTFELRKNLGTTERARSISCFNYGLENACVNNTGTFYTFFNSRKLAVFTYMELGNYFSDFSNNISAYGFYNIESTIRSKKGS